MCDFKSGHAQAKQDGCKIYYEVFTPTGPFVVPPKVLVFQHGYTGSSRNWKHALPFFLPSYVCVLIDGRGCGNSGKQNDPSSYNIQQYAEDVIAVVDHLNIRSFTFLGHSMGGGIGMLLGSGAHAHRIEGLILVTPIPSRGVYDPQNTHEVARQDRKRFSLEDYARLKKAAWVRTERIDVDPEAWKRVAELDLACPDAYYDNSWKSMIEFKAEHLLKQISAPTLMVVGASDNLLNPNLRDYALLPNASLHVFSRVAHYPASEVPAQFAEVILDFLQHGPHNAAKVAANTIRARSTLSSSRL